MSEVFDFNTNAVSYWFISLAIASISASLKESASKTIEQGLPPRGVVVNASTNMKGNFLDFASLIKSDQLNRSIAQRNRISIPAFYERFQTGRLYQTRQRGIEL